MFSRSADRAPDAAGGAPVAAWAFAAVAIAGAGRVLWWYWPGSVFDGVTSHIWTALAWNFAHGEFYRPPLGPDGYGGTRYMPLLFVAHGLLIRAGVDPIHGGVVLMQGSVACAVCALFIALRTAGVAIRTALPLSLSVFGTVIYQQYCTDLNPDYLAASLALTAIVLAWRADGESSAIAILAGFVFALATLTKLTAIFYIVAAVWPRVGTTKNAENAENAENATIGRDDTSRSWRPLRAFWIPSAGYLVAAAAALLVAAIAGIQAASGGVFIGTVATTLSGGMTAGDVLRAPLKFAHEVAIDPFVAVPFALASWCVLWRRQPCHSGARVYLVVATAVTVLIFASPGTVGNHLVDLHLASTLVVGIALSEGALPAPAATVAYASLSVVLAAISIPIPRVPSVIGTLRARGRPARAIVRALHDEFLPPGTRYLSTDPIVAILNDERPALLDAFHLDRFVREGSPAGRDFERRIRGHEYDVVVERGRQDAAPSDNAVERLIDANYLVTAIRPPFEVLTPRLHP